MSPEDMREYLLKKTGKKFTFTNMPQTKLVTKEELNKDIDKIRGYL